MVDEAPKPNWAHGINAALYDENTAKLADKIPGPIDSMLHPIEANKATWAADKAAGKALLAKLGISQQTGGRGV